MISTMRFLLETHLDQVLIVACGYLLSRTLLLPNSPRPNSATTEYSDDIDLPCVYTLGVLWFALVGAVSIISPVPTRTIVGMTFVLVAGLSYYHRVSLSEIGRAYRLFCLYPFLIFLVPAIFFLSHFSGAEISKGIDPWVLIERTSSYHVPDLYLQWLVSDNIYNERPFETNFNPDGKHMWSAGDRPVLIGLLDATFSQITNTSLITLYYLRVILIASLVLPCLNLILRDELKVQRMLVRYLTLFTVAISPFFLVNTIYTWPKMAGLAFGMMGFSLFLKSVRSGRLTYALLSGMALALGLISHTAAMFCLIGALLYTLGAWALVYRTSISLARIALLIGVLIVPVGIISQTHGRLLSRVTNQTNLLPRVQLCRGGSYAVVTPVESLLTSCKRYYRREGMRGILADRGRSIRRAFEFTPAAHLSGIYRGVLQSGNPGEYLRSLNTPYLLHVPTSIGHTTPVFVIILVSAYLISLSRYKVLPFTTTSLLLFTGLALLLLFGCMLAEYSEMSAHVVPFVAPVFIQLGILLELHRLWRPGFLVYCAASVALSVSVLLARLNAI